MDDSRTTVLSLEASAILQGQASRRQTTIRIGCSTHDSLAHLMLTVGGRVTPDRDGQGRVWTGWREDTAPPTREQWAVADDGATLVSMAYDQRDMIRRLRTHRRILVELPLAAGQTAVADFRTDGLETALPRLSSACGWKP